MMATRSTSVARAVLVFSVSGIVVLLMVGAAGVLVLREIGTDQATREAQRIATVAAHGIVEPRMREGVISGDANSLATLDAIVTPAVIQDPIVRVELWTREGELVYSDATDLIGSLRRVTPAELEVLGDDGVLVRRIEPPSGIGLDPDLGPLLEVTLPVHTPKGTAVLFQATLRFDAVTASGRRLWTAFWPVLAVALVALALLQIPLAWRLARRVRASQRDREQLLRRAIDSSDLERRRIAGDLHDGPVQQLAGLSMSLAAAADDVAATDPVSAETLREASGRTRQGMRSLRSAVMGISLPTLRRAGLRAALSDLVSPLSADGLEASVRLDVTPSAELPPEVESLLFRASQEAIRNVVNHARARRVTVTVTANGRLAVLEVDDDGVGFSRERPEVARLNGHVGLSLLHDLVADAGGELDVRSVPGEGTTLRLEVPLR